MDRNAAQLRRLRLKNFRAFSSLDIDFAPLTLLTGANSSGKSSVLSAIAAVLQTRSGRLFPFDFIPNGVNCALGGFKDLVHGGGARTQFSIGLSITKADASVDLEGTYRYSPVGDHILPAASKFESRGGSLEIAWDTTNARYMLRYISKGLSDGKALTDASAVLAALAKMPSNVQIEVPVSGGRKELRPPTDHEALVAELERHILKAKEQQGKWLPVKVSRAHEIRAELAGDLATAGFMSSIARISEDLAEQFTYIGPVRAYPERYYSLVERGTVVDPIGALSMQQLAVWRRNRPRLFREVVRLLSELHLVDSVRPSSSSDDILKVLVKPTNQRRFINVADVGFGLSQVLPIVAKDVALGGSGTVLVNQPEVHLHPSAQAQLGNYFSGRLENRRYVIETHSEYLINRLRLLVAESKLNADDVAIWYFDWDAAGRAVSHRISIRSDGNLSGAPKSFFSTYSSDAFKLVASGFES